MCGFAGFWSAPRTDSAQLTQQVQTMADSIRHRGPDDSGCWVDASAGIAFGFRRLSILDLTSAGHQPMLSPTGRHTVMFNGEIYNHRELRQQLSAAGHTFRGHGDTEVLCAGFDEWGIEPTLRRLRGMFAIAVWDAERRCLSLARDRLGIKPLFVHQHNGLISFASELKALAAAPSFDTEIDQHAVRSILQWLYVPAPRSIYAHTLKLPQGHVLHLPQASTSICASKPYWSLAETVLAGAEDRRSTFSAQSVVRLEELLLEATSLHLDCDVALGAFLSGGIDSSLVVALAQKVTGSRLKTFCVAFDETEHDE